MHTVYLFIMAWINSAPDCCKPRRKGVTVCNGKQQTVRRSLKFFLVFRDSWSRCDWLP